MRGDLDKDAGLHIVHVLFAEKSMVARSTGYEEISGKRMPGVSVGDEHDHP
jgi:hypothetical protein